MEQQIELEVLRDDQHHDLQDDLHRVGDLLHHGPDIGFLVRQEDGIFIREQIGADRVAQIHQVDQPKVLDARVALDEDIQEGQQTQARRQNERRHQPIHQLIEVHQLAQLFAVIHGGGFVHAEDHGRTDAQLCEVQHAQNV